MRIPFTIPKVYAGCAKVEGFLCVETEHLVLEYKMSDNLFGALSTGIIRRIVKYDDLDAAEYRLGFFKPRLILSARTLSAFEKLPGAEHALFTIHIPLRYWRRLRPITSEINLYLSYTEADRYRHRLPGI